MGCWAFFLVFLGLVSLGAGCVSDATAAAPGAPPRAVLVELFTSEGCSSCPAAEAFVRDLPRQGLARDRVVALAFHVDYWDDLGWKDPFASPAFSERQRQYVRSGRLLAPGGETGIAGAYTPQMIIDGAVHFSGARRDVARAEIARAAAAPAVVLLTASAAVVAPDRVVVTARLSPPPAEGLEAPAIRADPAARAALPSSEAWRLTVALAMKAARTRVTRGENAGETLEEASIVRVLSEPVDISAAPLAPAVRVAISRPLDLDWRRVELAAFVQSATTFRVVAVRDIPLPSIPPAPPPSGAGAWPSIPKHLAVRLAISAPSL